MMETFDKKNMEAVMQRIDASHSPGPVSLNHLEPPIFRLPAELLQEIFLLIVNAMPDCPSIFSFGNKTMSANFSSPPLLFTRVCRLWRVVAHSTTGIWSCINVELPGYAIKLLEPFLPSLLQFWLALSGSRPLTLRIQHHFFPAIICKCSRGRVRSFPQADRQLLEILFAEKGRWETVVGASRICADEDIFVTHQFITPQLRTLECLWSDVGRFHAPDLCRLLIINSWLDQIHFIPAITCRNIRHLHLLSASANVIHCTSAIFPHLKTIAVNSILTLDVVAQNTSSPTTHSCLESMTLPIHGDLIDVFRGSHFPVLQKLTFIMGEQEQDINIVMAALAATASCNVKVIDLQMVDEVDVDVDIIKPLFSVVAEVTVRGQVICSGLATSEGKGN
ncbi:hypothetical protein DFH29DRAFT_1043737 [Suillus ampliporus]|nr:hypothetical protein DFH29DRAFT_1043737 [Suillus ampliporus]